MNKTVRIMDVDLNILDDSKLEEKVREYFTNDYMNVILLASQKLLLKAAENREFREKLIRADLILPGEEELLSLHYGSVLKEDGIIVNYHCLETLLTALRTENKTIYVVLEKEEHLPYIEGFFKYFQADMVIVGSTVKPETTDEAVVNAINSLAPDVLLVDLPVPGREEWIMNHSTQLNSKLCIGMGGIMEQMIKEYKAEPAAVSRFHLTGLYNALVRKNYYKKAKEERRFRRKVREYVKKREENKNENSSK